MEGEVVGDEVGDDAGDKVGDDAGDDVALCEISVVIALWMCESMFGEFVITDGGGTGADLCVPTPPLPSTPDNSGPDTTTGPDNGGDCPFGGVCGSELVHEFGFNERLVPMLVFVPVLVFVFMWSGVGEKNVGGGLDITVKSDGDASTEDVAELTGAGMGVPATCGRESRRPSVGWNGRTYRLVFSGAIRILFSSRGGGGGDVDAAGVFPWLRATAADTDDDAEGEDDNSEDSAMVGDDVGEGTPDGSFLLPSLTILLLEDDTCCDSGAWVACLWNGHICTCGILYLSVATNAGSESAPT